MVSYTAKYTKISSGYMGQLVEWPEVVTEGRDLEDCRNMLRDALKEMVLAYRQLGKGSLRATSFFHGAGSAALPFKPLPWSDPMAHGKRNGRKV
jgi:predicted RNase H-like HicB family nuclease